MFIKCVRGNQVSTLHWVIKIGTTALNNGVPRLPQRFTGAKRTVRSPFKPTTLPHAGLERRAPTLRRPYRSGAAKWMPETDRRAAHYKLKDIRMSAYRRLAQMKESVGVEFRLITIPKAGVPQTMTSTGGNPYEFWRATAANLTLSLKHSKKRLQL